MSSNQTFEEDVFVEEDLEEDEYLYQVAINFGDPNGSPSQKVQPLEYHDDTDEDDSKEIKKNKNRLPHNPRSEGIDARKTGTSPTPTQQQDHPAPAAPIVPPIVTTDPAESTTNDNEYTSEVEPGSVLEFAKVKCGPVYSSIFRTLITPIITDYHSY